MAFEVIVVGGGIGGLTTAALLAARGVSVCLLERASSPGGCAANFRHLDHDFEAGAGLYAGWQPDGLHARIFAELPVAAPEAREVAPAYTVRLPEGLDVRVGGPAEEFHARLREAFPECGERAVRFYREVVEVAEALRRAARRAPALAEVSGLGLLRLAASEPRLAPRILAARNETAARHLVGTSARFRHLLDAQLQLSAQVPVDDCAYLYAAVALAEPLSGMHALRGGGQALADALAESIRKSGGTLRLDTTALRLAFDSRDRASGVTLLSGETLEASRAVVSNLTLWDTFGKLIGAERVPAPLRTRLKHLRGWGAYQIFLSLEEEAARRLPSDKILAPGARSEGEPFDPESGLFMLGCAPAWDARAPVGRRAATLTSFTDAERWFTFHSDETEHEAQDEQALETLWGRLHAALPELGAGAEVYETATPRTTYERTRRRLGMVGGVGQSLDLFGANAPTHRTHIANLFLVGDTVFPGSSVAAVTHSALVVANELDPVKVS